MAGSDFHRGHPFPTPHWKKIGGSRAIARLPLFGCGSVAAAGDQKDGNDEDPNPVIAKEIAQTAVIHNRTSVNVYLGGGCIPPRITIL